jgi:nucleoside-diphosphate-sugar epimerase
MHVELVDGDFFDIESLRPAVIGVDCIYHVAGVVASKTKEGFFRGNQHATRQLLEAVRQYNPHLSRFVHVSSFAAVGPSLDGRHSTEDTPYHPITTYGRSKMEAEKEVAKCGESFPWTIVRPPAVYGPRDTATFDFFKTASRGLIPLVGFDSKLVSLVHVFDLVRGIVLAGQHSSAVRQIYNIGSEQYYDWAEIGDTTMKVLGKKAIKVRIPEPIVFAVAGLVGFVSLFGSRPSVLNWEKGRDMVQKAWTCDISKAKKELGYRESISLEEGIRETIEWYRSMGWLK